MTHLRSMDCHHVAKENKLGVIQLNNLIRVWSFFPFFKKKGVVSGLFSIPSAINHNNNNKKKTIEGEFQKEKNCHEETIMDSIL